MSLKFELKLVTGESHCINHGKVNEAYELVLPDGVRSSQTLSYCASCVKTLHQVTGNIDTVGLVSAAINLS